VFLADWLASPDHWSPVAVAAATKIFASNLNAKMAQRFYNLILLPHVRNDMEQNKKLNWHLYMALKKSVFKPAAFYKGIVLPLCEVRPCLIDMRVFRFSLSLGLADFASWPRVM
jgi:essential nuclear protein 1